LICRLRSTPLITPFSFKDLITSTEFLVHLSATQTAIVNNNLSQLNLLNFGVSQGFVLGPLLIILYTKAPNTLSLQHSITNQSFADDTQLHDSCRPDQIHTSVQSMQDCISDVKTWMTSNKLKLNNDKTEYLLIASNKPSVPNHYPTSIHKHYYSVFLAGKQSGRKIFSNNLSMESHMSWTSSDLEIHRNSENYNNASHYPTIHVTKTFLCAFVLSKRHCCNSLLTGSPKHLLDKLQKVQHYAARIIFKARKHEHIKPLLQKLH